MTDDSSLFGKPIYSYTRAQAIDDGVLVDVSDVAREAGFKVPVAITYAVFSQCVEWSDDDSHKQTTQDASGRLWDVLVTARAAARANDEADTVHYTVACVPCDGMSRDPVDMPLKMVIGPGDTAAPVVTIMLPAED